MLFLTAIVLIISRQSFAYRPLETEDAGVAGKGVVQAEYSWDYLELANRVGRVNPCFF